MQEGVIKFKIENWIQTKPLTESFYKEIEDTRKILYKFNLIGVYKDLNLGFGNISKKLTGDEFVITGSQTGEYKDLNGSHYTVIKSVDFQTNSVVCEGPIKPSSESITHAAFYASNKKITSVIHIHSLKLWEKLIENNYLSTSEKAEYGSPELSKNIIEIAKNVDLDKPLIVVMKGHKEGIIGAGNNINQTLEELLRIYNLYL
ncbi:MAG: hypothetical protein A2086_00780 [Spirochaetes bacterium GWD1_27_9]|nr:MAG: hypothetical protein A2Y34_02790 [Spirochaetes bacterium GWC1_27_15]OHD32544.1 MAG: hypothetical protein A2086_00780 [Spirochaetes bacterium GWD1_27_9]